MAREEVIIGSRRQARAEQVAAELNTDVGELLIRGMENSQAAAAADIVVLTVPYTVHLSTLDRVKAQVPGKIFIDVSVAASNAVSQPRALTQRSNWNAPPRNRLPVFVAWGWGGCSAARI
jgi:predicted dinucleotide-binding enzyme